MDKLSRCFLQHLRKLTRFPYNLQYGLKVDVEIALLSFHPVRVFKKHLPNNEFKDITDLTLVRIINN